MYEMNTSVYIRKKMFRGGRGAIVRPSLLPLSFPSFVSLFLSHVSCLFHMRRILTVPHTLLPSSSSSSSGSAGALFRSTSPLCISFINNKHFSPREAVDVHHEVAMRNENVFSSGLEDSIDWNLLRDPTGGLEEEENSAEELSEQELLQEMTSRQLLYTPEVFYILFTPLIDIVSILVDHQLLPETSKRRKNCLLKKAKQRAKELKKKEEEEAKQRENLAVLEQQDAKKEENPLPPEADPQKEASEETNTDNGTSPPVTVQDRPPPRPMCSATSDDMDGCSTTNAEKETNGPHPLTDAATTAHGSSMQQDPSTPSDAVSLAKHARVTFDRAHITVSNWFLDGKTALARPGWTKEKMGPERYHIFTQALLHQYEKMEPAMPLSRFFRRHPSLPASLFIPFLRQLSMEMYSTERRAAAVKVVPGIIVTLANGRVVPKSFHLPGVDPTHSASSAGSSHSLLSSEESSRLREKNVDEQRVRLITEMFMAAAQETGTTDLAYLALQLLRANGLTVPFTLQKQLTNVFSTASRITTDWRVRSSGVLAECLPKWKVYLKQVKSDVCNAWIKQEKESLLCRDDAPVASRHAKHKEDSTETAITKAAAFTQTETEPDKKKKKRVGDRTADVTGVPHGGKAADDTDRPSVPQDENNDEVVDYFSRERPESALDAPPRTGREGAAEVSSILHHHIQTAMDRRVREWVRIEAAAQMKSSSKTVGKKKKAEKGGSDRKVGPKRRSCITKDVLESVLRREYVDDRYNNKIGEFAEDEEEEEEENNEEEEEEEVEEEEEEEDNDEEEEEEEETEKEKKNKIKKKGEHSKIKRKEKRA